MSIGKSVRLFVAEGTPGGLLTAEIMNWTGHVTAAPDLAQSRVVQIILTLLPAEMLLARPVFPH